jgi:hypothetical protein
LEQEVHATRNRPGIVFISTTLVPIHGRFAFWIPFINQLNGAFIIRDLAIVKPSGFPPNLVPDSAKALGID